MEKIKETSQIIETILQFYRLNAKNFAEKIGTSPTQVYDLLKGKIKKLSPDMTEKILTAFPDISRFFLLTFEMLHKNFKSYTIKRSLFRLIRVIIIIIYYIRCVRHFVPILFGTLCRSARYFVPISFGTLCRSDIPFRSELILHSKAIVDKLKKASMSKFDKLASKMTEI